MSPAAASSAELPATDYAATIKHDGTIYYVDDDFTTPDVNQHYVYHGGTLIYDDDRPPVHINLDDDIDVPTVDFNDDDDDAVYDLPILDLDEFDNHLKHHNVDDDPATG